MRDKQTIYVSSYPKSGSTWLTRLLADVLNSPSGGCMPSEDIKEVATEGQDRPGPYVVRKGHFVLVDNKMQAGRFRTVDSRVVPVPHRLNWQNITNEKIVFLVRDPRDICVSGAWHWQQSVEVFLDRMIKGDVARCGRWDEYNDHQDTILMPGSHVLVRYEDLLLDTEETIVHILCEILRLRPGAYAFGRIRDAIRRNSFAVQKSKVGNDEREMRRHNIRKGIAGDWKNHFTPAMNDKIWSEFGWMMERLGYEK